MGWSRKEKNGDHFIYDSIFRMGMSVTAKIFKTQTSYHKTNTTPHLQKVIDKNFYAALRFWERNFHSLCKRRDSFPKFSAEFYLKNLAFRFLLIFAVFISFPLLGAQTILLKNGTSLKGDVTGQNEKVITVRTADGETQTKRNESAKKKRLKFKKQNRWKIKRKSRMRRFVVRSKQKLPEAEIVGV